MKLNDRQIKNAKPAEKPFKLNDGKGLYLYINTSGGKLWRFDFSYNGKRKTLSIGKYPTVSLVEARQAAENARRLLVSGQDPSEAKQQEKRERQAAALNTFESIARRWHSDNLIRWKENHAARVLRYFETDVFPVIGAMSIQEIRVSDIKVVIDGVMARGVNNTAEKIREWIGAIFDYAVMLEIVETNPAYSLRKYIPAKQTDHRPALPREELTEFFRRLILAEIEPQNRIALTKSAPKEAQARIAITLWSAVKSKFGCSYKEVPAEQFPEVLSVMSRVAVENGVLYGEVLDALPKAEPKLPIDGLDIERFAVTVYYGAWALEMLKEVALPLRQLGHPKAATMYTLWNESRSFLRHNAQALQRVLPALEPDHAAHVRGSLDRLKRLNARFI